MKKILLGLLCTGVLLSVYSCDDDDDSNFTQKNYLEGTWNVTETGSLNNSGQLRYHEHVNDSLCDGKDHLVFKNDLSVAYTDYSDTLCKTIVKTSTYRPLEKVFSFPYRENNLEKSQGWNITSLSNSRMELNYTDTISDQLVFFRLTRQ